MSNDLLNTYKDARMKFLAVVQLFPSEKRLEKLFEGWSLKDVVAHIAAWEGYTIDVMDDFVAGNAPYLVEDKEEFNQSAVKESSEQTWDEVYSDLLEMGSVLIEAYKSLDLEMYNAAIWPEHEHTPHTLLAEATEHYLVHTQDLEFLGNK